MLLFRMSLIIEDERKWIPEHRYGFFKSYAVFTQVCFCLVRIPFEFHASSIA